MSGAEHLVHMANDIGNFFRGSTDREAAIRGISNHIKSFWTPRMRRKLMSDLEGGDEELDELPREALRLLKEHPDFKPQQLPEGGPEGGGDAG
jgi:formate dehydrogenase subunit delta